MKIIKNGFKNERLGIELDVYEINGKEWFRGKQVAKILGYRDSERFTRIVSFKENISTHNVGSGEVKHNETFVNEFALYEVVCKINKTDIERYTKAREFQQWVFSEVLPSLRKNNFYVDKDNITESQAEKLKIYLFDLCDMGKISLGKASELMFGNKKELKERLIKLGWLDYENCTFIQQKFKATNDKVYELFVTNISSTYEKGVVKSQMQMSITNAGYIYLKNLFENNPELGKAGEL